MVLSPTDLVGHLACAHLTTLDRDVALGLRSRPEVDDPSGDLVRRLGDAHERAVLTEMRRSLDVAEIPRSDDLVAAEQLTLDAMKRGADVVYQATFFDGRWRGHADFLIRNDKRASDLGDWSYDVADTKLARHLKVPALLQMAVYAERLTRLQGVPPDRLTVILGTQERVSVPYVDVAAYARRTAADLEGWLADPPTTYPVRDDHCAICPWADQCRRRWRADDDLVLVPHLRRTQRERFRQAGIVTVDQLGAATDAALASVSSVGDVTKRNLAAQAREYLWGISDMADGFAVWWAHDPPAEKAAFEQVVDHLMAAWRRHPAMHVYHYAPYEPTVLKRLSQRYATRVDDVDALLRGERLVDLYAVVRRSVRVGTESYSIKELERLYDPTARNGAQVKSAGSSIVEYERWRAEDDDRILAAIEAYNRDDCISTRRLRDWLEDRRQELRRAGHDVPRPDGSTAEAAVHEQAPDPELVAVAEALVAAIPDDLDQRTGDQRARALLASLLQWHRREMRAEWWEYFRVRALSLDDLVDEAATLGGLRDPVLIRSEKRSSVWRYAVPPQECRLRVGERADHAGGLGGSSEGAAPDLEHGFVELKRAAAKELPHPAGLLASSPVATKEQAAALLRVGRWVADHGIDAPGPYRGVRDLLLGRRPRLAGEIPLRRPGEDGTDALCRVAPALGGVLPVQGPPGSGKTYAGAHAVVELVRAGRTVGITALSHRVITNLLDAVMRFDDGSVYAIQKADDGQASTHGRVTVTSDNAEVETAVALGTANVVAGTAWLFARLEVHVDVLVVDEAGQLSLANTVAAGAAADSLILLGDPQQLRQPGHGVHPEGADVSALEHVLDGLDTVPPERGLFLETTRRMHPAVCAPVSDLSYDGRLQPHRGLENQLVGGSDELAGAGLRWRPVRHIGRSVESPEEVDVVARLVDRLTGRPWTDADGRTRPLGAEDILVVAPYNAQVARLLRRVGDQARVGTVDKFQGQQAPVVIVSLTTSSAADAPRGAEFVANRNRLNVAVSRARSLAVLVGNPALMSSQVTTVEQLRGVNALCTLVERAQ